MWQNPEYAVMYTNTVWLMDNYKPTTHVLAIAAADDLAVLLHEEPCVISGFEPMYMPCQTCQAQLMHGLHKSRREMWCNPRTRSMTMPQQGIHLS